MEERKNKLARLTMIVGSIVVVAIIAGTLLSNKRIISPVPEESGIRIIFITPTILPTAFVASPSATVVITPTPTKRPPTRTPTPTKENKDSATSSATQ